MEKVFDNTKDVLCVVIDMEDPMKTVKGDNITEYLDKEEAKSILKTKILE